MAGGNGSITGSTDGWEKFDGPMLARDRQAELPRLTFPKAFEEMLAAERNVTIVPPDFRLGTGMDGMSIDIDPQVHRGFAPAFADRLQLDEGVSQGK